MRGAVEIQGTTVTCPSCEAPVADDHMFCASCGAPTRRRAPGDAPAADLVVTRAVAPVPSMLEARPTGPGEVASHETGPGTAVVGPVTDGPEPAPLAPCPRCGAQNSARRQQCARCGNLLGAGASPEPAAGVEHAPADAPAPWEDGSAPRRRRGVLVAAALLGVGALGVGGAALAGSGVFDADAGTQQDPRAAGFDADRYAGEPTVLDMPPTIVADTEHEPIGDNRYDATLVADGDLATAWNSDGDVMPDGIGERLRIDLDQAVWLSEVQVANGYQKSEKSFTDNARPTLVRLTLDGVAFDVALLDRQGVQTVSLDEPRLTTRLELEVLEASEGTTYEDLAISELALLGWPAVGVDVERAAVQRGDVPTVIPEVVGADG